MINITINQKVKGGAPTITGTRVPVSHVVYLHKQLKKSPSVIASKYYTNLSVNQIIGAIKWYETNKNRYGWVGI